VLKDDLLDDLSEILSSDEFAVEVLLTGGKKVIGIFDDEFRGINIQGGDIRTTAPQVLCRAVDVATVKLGDVITVLGVSYHVIERQPDGVGLVTMILSVSSNGNVDGSGDDETVTEEDGG